MTLLFVVGMRAEAALLPRGARVTIGRAMPAAPAGATAVLSFGIAGGLDRSLRPGDLVVATRVRGPGGAYATDPAWTSALMRATGARPGVVAGSGNVVATPAAKRALHAATGALIVDLESEAAGAFAAAHRLPFAVLRAVADPVERALPHAAQVGLRPDGRVAPGRGAARAAAATAGAAAALAGCGRQPAGARGAGGAATPGGLLAPRRVSGTTRDGAV